MKGKSALAMAALSVSLATMAPMVFPSEARCAPAEAVPIECPERTGEVFYQNSGLRLFVPEALDGLLLTQAPRKGEAGPGRLFSVSERASIAAAEATGYDAEAVQGAGWLFSVGWVDAQRFREMLCMDMTGAEIFARDAEGNRYIFYHPTDVRYMREDNEAMMRDRDEWARLNEWAWNSVRRDFILNNLDRGLTAETYDNSSVGTYLARAAYRPGTNFTVSTTQFGPLASPDVAAAPFAERLIRNVSYQMADLSETPDGEYVVLAFPDENIRFDFFKASGKENYVREVRADGSETLYKATFADGATKAAEVMQRWYWALAARREK